MIQIFEKSRFSVGFEYSFFKIGVLFSSSDIKNRDGKAEELIIHCDCGNYISLGLD